MVAEDLAGDGEGDLVATFEHHFFHVLEQLTGDDDHRGFGLELTVGLVGEDHVLAVIGTQESALTVDDEFTFTTEFGFGHARGDAQDFGIQVDLG